MHETLEEALGLEEERAVRDQFRDRRLTELVEVPVVIERRFEPPPGRQERVLARANADARRRRARARLIRRIAIGLLVIAAAIGASLALRFRGASPPCQALPERDVPAGCIRSLHSVCDLTPGCEESP